MLVFEFQADVGLNLGRFTDWLIDDKLLNALMDKNRLLLEAENLAEREQLDQLLRAASNYGFTLTEGSHWRFLPAVFRYLDRFEELAHALEQRESVLEISPADAAQETEE